MDAVGEYGGLRLDQTRRIEDVANGYTEFQDGDVIVAKITPCFENGKGAVAKDLENSIAYGTTELHVLRPTQGLDTAFLFYLTISHPYRKLGEGEMYGAGGQKRVPPEYCMDFPVPSIPLGEQRAIATFLDRETARIDALIEKKQRQIELLQEKRTALISHAVTKGLDPNVKMKDSGVLSFGEIPTHWRMSQLRYLTKLDRQIMYGIVLPGPHVDDGVPIVKGGNCEPGRLRLEVMSRTHPDIEARYVRSRLATGDIVYAIRGSIGQADQVPAELEGANLTQDAARISPREGVDHRWLLHAVRSSAFFANMDAFATGATIRGINIWDLKRAPICLPPQSEQEEIASHLDRSMTRLNGISENVQTSINRLHEYRTALISAAVTGKIDVREEAA